MRNSVLGFIVFANGTVLFNIMRMIRLLCPGLLLRFLFISAFLSFSCSGETGISLQIPQEDESWQTGNLKDAGIEAESIINLVQSIRSGTIANIHSLLIVRHNKLVVEEYFNGSHIHDIHTQQSVTKSVTSILTGIAIDQHFIQSVDDKVLSYFPEYTDIQHVDEYKKQLTIGNLLNMQTGMLWSENPYAGSSLQQLNESSGDWVKFVLNHPMQTAPGTVFQYNSGGAIVLSGILTNSSQLITNQFANQFLFEPLKINTARWYKSPYNALPHTGGGLLLKARDMAKIGQLILNNGLWNGEQIVSREWIDLIKKRNIYTKRGYYNAWYSHMWWLLPYAKNASSPPSDDIITASGAQGQWIFVVPKHQLVVVVTGNTQNGEDELQAVNFLYNKILPAVKE